MGEVIHCGGAVHDPKTHNLCQIADVDSVVIRWANADLVTQILLDETSAPFGHLCPEEISRQ